MPDQRCQQKSYGQTKRDSRKCILIAAGEIKYATKIQNPHLQNLQATQLRYICIIIKLQYLECLSLVDYFKIIGYFVATFLSLHNKEL